MSHNCDELHVAEVQPVICTIQRAVCNKGHGLFDTLAKLGTTWFRTNFPWRKCQPHCHFRSRSRMVLLWICRSPRSSTHTCAYNSCSNYGHSNTANVGCVPNLEFEQCYDTLCIKESDWNPYLAHFHFNGYLICCTKIQI